MPDSTTLRGAQDRERINIHQDHELRDWARRFNATPQQIKDAVGRVGDRAADVEMDLKGTRSTTNAETGQQAGRASSSPRSH
jgi:hypothetical protein